MSIPIYPSDNIQEYEPIKSNEVESLFNETYILKPDIVQKKQIKNKVWYFISEEEGSDLFKRIKFRLYRSYQQETRGNITFSENKYKNIKLEPLYSLALTPSKDNLVVMMNQQPVNDFIISKGFVKGVGSLWNWGQTNKDIDIMIEQYSNTELYQQTTKIINNIFNKKSLNNRLNLHYAEDALGTFTNYKNLFDLVIVPSSVGEEHKQKFTLFPETAMEFEKPLAGRYENSEYNIKDLLEIIKKEKWSFIDSFYCGIKRDGMTSRVDWGNGKVAIHSGAWRDITDNIPTIVDEFKNRVDSGSCIGEIELYIKGEHQNRADASASASHKNSPNEPNLRITLYDLFYYNGRDYSQSSYNERRNQLMKLTESEHIVVSKPEYKVNNPTDLEKAITRCMLPSYSEGAVIKNASKQYQFKVHPAESSMIKIKKTYNIIGEVVDKIPVKDSDKTFTYVIGI